MDERKETYKEGVTLKDLKEGETIYISKMESGYKIIFECDFISFNKGIVRGKIRKVEPNWATTNRINTEITARHTKCFLWGRDTTNIMPRCHWFNKKGETE